MPKPIIHYDKVKDKKDLEDLIPICPTNVFEKQGNKVVVARPEDCIGCKACESSFEKGEVTVED